MKQEQHNSSEILGGSAKHKRVLNDGPATKKLRVGKPSSAIGKSNRKGVKGAVKDHEGRGTKYARVDLSAQVDGHRKSNPLVSSNPKQSTNKVSKASAEKKHQKGKHLKNKHPGTEGAKIKNVDLDVAIQKLNGPGFAQKHSNKVGLHISKNSFKLKKQKRGGTSMEKVMGTKSKMKVKIFTPNKQLRAGGTNREQLTKPDWVAIKKQKKELRVARKQKRSSYNITVEAKKLWEILRNQNITNQSESIQNGVVKMHNLLKSQLGTFVMCHDMSRVVQWLIKNATAEIRVAIIEELKPCVKKMMVDRYASKCIGSLLKYGGKEAANVIIASCMGCIVKFMSNVIAHPFIEKAYAEYATDQQKTEFHLEFYSDLYKSSKDSEVKCLADTYKNTPALKNAFLTSTKEHIKRVLNKNNATNRSTLLYTVMADFLNECSTADRDEILSVVREWIFDLPSTKEAGYVGMLCIWHATNKEKKTIVKGLKGHIVEFAKSKHLQFILFAVFSLVDDTVLLGKALIPEVKDNIKELASHVVGRKLIVHLVSYGNTIFFHPSEMKILQEGETTGTSKKDVAKKKEELVQLVSKSFLNSVAEEPEFWFQNSDTCLTALAILTGAEDGDDKLKAFEAIATLLVNPDASAQENVSSPRKGSPRKGLAGKGSPEGKQQNLSDESTETVETTAVAVISHGAVHLTTKHLIKEYHSFSQILMQKLTNEAMEYWIPHNRGCFTLIHLLETLKEDVVTRVTDLLKKHQLLLSAQSSAGAKILLQKI